MVSKEHYPLIDPLYKAILSNVYLDDGWTVESAPSANTKYNLTIQRKQIFPDRVQAVRVIARVPLKADDILQVVLNIDNRCHISDHTKEAYFLDRMAVEDSNDVYYTCLEAPTRLVSPRDFVVARRWDQLSDCCALIGADLPQSSSSTCKGYIVALRSAERKECPPKSGIVRGEFVMQAIMIHESEDGESCEIRVLNQVELGGWIPSPVQSYFQKGVPSEMPELLERGVAYEKSQKKDEDN